MSNLITTPSTPHPFSAFSLHPSVKAETLARIDRVCSLYYVTIGSIYNVCQSAMVDARELLRQDKSLFRHKVKQEVNLAFLAYDQWNASMKRILKDRYQIWLDISDSVDSDLRQQVQILFYSVDNFFLKCHVPHSKTFSRMETALVLLDITRDTFRRIFEHARKLIGVDVAPLFAGADASDIFFHWHAAITAASRSIPGFPDVDVNADPTAVQAVRNIQCALSSDNIYNHAGEYALRLNPDQWRHLDREDRIRLKQGIPLDQQQ